MSLSGFLSQSQQPWVAAPPNPYEPEAPLSSPYAPVSPHPEHQLRIRRLPANTTDSQLRLMLLFSEEVVDVNILPADASRDPGYRSAIVRFKSAAGAQQAKEMLHGKYIATNPVDLIVENIIDSPAEPVPANMTGPRRYPLENPIPTQTNGSAPLPSPSATARQPNRFSEAFPPNSLYTNTDVADSDYYQNIFSPQSPIGNHLANHQTLSLGKTLIHNTAEDDETRELLKDPVAYAENGATQQRRATAPHLPITRMANLSLNGTNGAGPITPYTHPNMPPLPNHGNGMSPTVMNGANHAMNFQMNNYNRNNFPPVNPADQNPPCNTLYVGNLPVDTSEEELKSIFQKQRGYRRLCFRTKQNGPMCFVEFEDVTHATRALHELYGKLLHNSTKGGIRLSFSKNPLGVRSNQVAGTATNGSMASMNGMVVPPVNGFQITNGPPPGLTAPPGLHRVNINGNPQQISNGVNTPLGYPGSNGNVWNSLYNSHSATASASPNGINPTYQSYMWADRS
ncbi:hypothetical protein F4861DRAFT_331741 [Xylaria intraflava]|nr:hypothetical protein F4861DRAFT_331741 [Xylaria intraflava]